MGLTLSTARVLAPISFVVDFAAQNYGMLSSPNMKEVHDANLSFFSPQPYFIGAFFIPQQIMQLVWLVRLWRADRRIGTDDKDVKTMVDYTPFYALGNFCIASWMIFWNQSDLATADVFVTINSLAQLYFIYARIPPMDLDSPNSVTTHVVSKMFAGIGVLDMIHSGSVAFFNHQAAPGYPSAAVKVLTGLGFAGLAATSDWILGGCLVYDLIALAVGQKTYGNPGWANWLWAYAGGTAAIVGTRNYMRPPYIRSRREGYQAL